MNNKITIQFIIFFLSITAIGFMPQTYANTKMKTLFWNIGANNYTIPFRNTGTSLDRSLVDIAYQNYDVLGLSEYTETSLDDHTVQALKENFQHSEFFPYSPGANCGIIVFSKYKFSSVSKKIDWVRMNWSEKVKEIYKRKAPSLYGNTANYERDYIRLTLNKEGSEFNFIFFHFMNPWPGLIEKVGKYAAGLSIMFGKFTPLSNQIDQLKDQFNADFKGSSKNKNIIMMGDSNCPYKYFGITSSCFRMLKKILTPVYDPQRLATFPAGHSVDAGKYPSIKIDHALTSQRLTNTLEVLADTVGSDHLGLSLESEER